MATQNLLLMALPDKVVDRLRPYAETLNLSLGQILHRPGQSIKDVYFPLDALISVTVTMNEARTTEAGMVGNREMVGVNAFMGGRETNQTEYICKHQGFAVRVAAPPLLEAFDQDKAVRDVMLRYTQAYIAQLSQNVACNRLHTIDKRLARWLLECRERLPTDDLGITHEYVAHMLGVRRAGVSETAAKLQKRGVIRCGRKTIRIVEQSGLEELSCECYRVIRNEYNRLLSPMLRKSVGTCKL